MSALALPAFPIAPAHRAWFAVVKGSWSADLQGGAIAGGVCAMAGIAVSAALSDVPPSLLLLGTISSVVTGAIGGAIGKLIFD